MGTWMLSNAKTGICEKIHEEFPDSGAALHCFRISKRIFNRSAQKFGDTIEPTKVNFIQNPPDRAQTLRKRLPATGVIWPSGPKVGKRVGK